MAEVAAAYEGGAETGEFALAGVGETAVEAFGHGEAKDGVADELKLLVVAGGCGRSLGVGLVGEGAMSEREGEQLRAVESVLKKGRERLAR